jgi:hypothetical protein
MRTVLVVIGNVVIALGIVWIVQWGGWVPWPLAHFSLPTVRWLSYGAIPVLSGFTLIAFAKRL